MGDDEADVDLMIRRAIAADPAAIAWILGRADTSAVPSILVMASLLEVRVARIDRAMVLATTIRDRQVAAIAAAHLRGEPALVDALARDHLVDHPDSVLVAWIASGAGGAAHERRS